MCSFLGSNGMHLVILALSGTNDVTALIQSTSSGHVVMHVRCLLNNLEYIAKYRIRLRMMAKRNKMLQFLSLLALASIMHRQRSCMRLENLFP